MVTTTPKTRILRRALETAGCREALADALHTDQQVLAQWLTGECAPDNAAFLTALDIVARGRLPHK